MIHRIAGLFWCVKTQGTKNILRFLEKVLSVLYFKPHIGVSVIRRFLLFKQSLRFDFIPNRGDEQRLLSVKDLNDKLIPVRREVRRKCLAVHVHVVDVISALDKKFRYVF